MSPLDRLGSLKVKLGVVIVAAVVVTAAVGVIGVRSGLDPLICVALAVVIALGLVQVLARGMTAPLRAMAAAARAMERGERWEPVRAASHDEVGELARAFNAMAAQLAETDRFRRDLVANVSHELRTPISALQAQLENIADGVQAPDPATIAAMVAQVDRLGRLVTQLLDLSRLEAGAAPLELSRFAVRDVLDGAVREARLHAPAEVALSVEARDGLTVAGDAERVHQVVANLVENAVRHSPRPGRVVVGASAAGEAVRIEVADEGPGIPPGQEERVFERFHRGDAARTAAEGGGAGLGLAIARWIVELHGGAIHAEPNQPRGCRMVVELPRAA